MYNEAFVGSVTYHVPPVLAACHILGIDAGLSVLDQLLELCSNSLHDVVWQQWLVVLHTSAHTCRDTVVGA